MPCAQRRQPSATSPEKPEISMMRCATSRRTISAFTASTPGVPPELFLHRAAAPMAADRRGRPSRSPAPSTQSDDSGRRVSDAGRQRAWRACCNTAPRSRLCGMPNLPGCGGSPGNGRPSAARSSLISQSAAVFHSRAFLAAAAFFRAFVIAQQVPDFVNEHRGVLFDRVRRQPRFVVIEAPVPYRPPCWRSGRS